MARRQALSTTLMLVFALWLLNPLLLEAVLGPQCSIPMSPVLVLLSVALRCPVVLIVLGEWGIMATIRPVSGFRSSRNVPVVLTAWVSNLSLLVQAPTQRDPAEIRIVGVAPLCELLRQSSSIVFIASPLSDRTVSQFPLTLPFMQWKLLVTLSRLNVA